MANAAAPLLAALEAAGAKLIHEDKAHLEALLAPIVSAGANAIIDAIAMRITMNGLAGMIAPALRNALTGAEPQIDAILNGGIAGGFDNLEALLDRLATTATA